MNSKLNQVSAKVSAEPVPNQRLNSARLTSASRSFLLMNLLTIFLINRSVVWSIKWPNCEKCLSVFLKTKMTSSNFVFLTTPQRHSVYYHEGVKKPENIYI